MNLGAFEKKGLVGVVVVGGNVFVIVVCGGGGAAADVENWNDGTFDDNGGGCGLATFVEKNGRFELAVAVVVVGKRTWTGGSWTECGTEGGWEDGGGWETGIGCWDI